MRLRRHFARHMADLPVPLWFALIVNAVFMVLSFLLGALLAPCLDWIGF